MTERLGRQVADATRTDRDIAMLESALTRPCVTCSCRCWASPEPWNSLRSINPASWSQWAELDAKTLQWRWHLHPLEPLLSLRGVLLDHPLLMFSSNGDSRRHGDLEFEQSGVVPDVRDLRDVPRAEPLPVYAPRRQPLPNTRIYSQHLLEESQKADPGTHRFHPCSAQ